MAPKARPAVGSSSHRTGGESQRETPRSASKREDSTSKKKKAAKKKPVSSLDPVSEPEEGPSLEDVAEIAKPVEEILTQLRAQLDEKTKALEALQQIDKAVAASQASKASEPEAKPASTPVKPDDEERLKRHQNVLRIWKSFASSKLAEMASSLDAALRDDAKLRALFDHIDADMGGSIDQEELDIALKGAGKSVTPAQLERMFSAADEDKSGDVDFDEFRDVVKGVKAAKAAFVIERGVRRHQSHQSVMRTKGKTLLSKEELEAAFGRALLQKTPKTLLQEWDRSKKGTLTRIEFRQGARDSFGLNFENKDIDEWFDQFDKNANGEIDLNELKDAFRSIKLKQDQQKAERQALEESVEALGAQAATLEATVRRAHEAVAAHDEALAQLASFRALPHLDAKLGAKLSKKIKSDKNPKGILSFEDVVAAWDVRRKVEGSVNKDEFVQLFYKEVGADSAPQPEVEALYATLDASAAGSLPIKSALQALIASVQTHAQQDAHLEEACASRKAAALEQQTALKQAPLDHAAKETATAAAAPDASAAAPAASPPPLVPQNTSVALAGRLGNLAGGLMTDGGAEAETDPLLAKLALLDGTVASPEAPAAGS